MPINKTPPDEPEFLCGICKREICEDCKSIAAEYEFLYERQKRELAAIIDENERLKAEAEKWKKRADSYERISKMGLPDLITSYIDHLAEVKA